MMGGTSKEESRRARETFNETNQLETTEGSTTIQTLKLHLNFMGEYKTGERRKNTVNTVTIT
jgi:hypothetical protein